ncbi:MAG: hypothetical protein IPM54_29945 [Polyangiaceae bacterium]|nr:hypothetical protein [Polyangiaceae bacterium]
MENDPRNRRPSSPKGTPKGWSIKKSEAKALLAEGHWTPDPDFSSTICDAFVSERGELLMLLKQGRSVLYASRAEEKAFVDAISKSPATHVLEGLLPQGPQFIEAVPGLVDELAVRLQLPRESLDGSLDSLDVVEEALLKKIRPRSRILEIPNLFASIIAYTGEVGRKLTGGHWHLNEVHGGIWEPYILFDNDSNYLNPFLEPYKSIAERRRGGLMLKALVVAHTSTALKHV